MNKELEWAINEIQNVAIDSSRFSSRFSEITIMNLQDALDIIKKQLEKLEEENRKYRNILDKVEEELQNCDGQTYKIEEILWSEE